MRFKNFQLFFIAFGMIGLLVSSAFADVLPVRVYATDTVAGYPSALKTSLVDPYQAVRFVVEKPDGAVVQIPAQADAEGVAKADFYGHQTKLAGQYKAAMVFPGSAVASPQTLFTVYPDQVSATQSTLRGTLQMAEAGTDTVFLVATLYDQYRNPIKDHQMKLISSRPEDTIEAIQSGATDQNGRATFKARSGHPGISVFTAMDTTSNQVLSDREEIVFFEPKAKTVTTNFSSLFKADIGGNGEVLPGPVDHFDIEGLPSTAKVNQELTMTVVARDQSGNVAKNYTGTILISVPDDENAVLPNNGEYMFKAADQGTFTFSLSLRFSQLGKQAVQVFDKNNFKIAGERTVEVVSAQAVTLPAGSATLSIKSPADGTELGNNTVVLSGNGPENINLKVFDNDMRIGDTETDGGGFFSFEAKNLESGSHVFYVMSEAGDVSRSVSVRIDTLPPVLNSFKMSAEGAVTPGLPVTFTISSEPDLEKASVRLQGVEENMTQTNPGTYEATVSAPAQDGRYPVDVILIDPLANKAEFFGKGMIEVSVPKPNNPPAVEGLEGVQGDGSVQLTWMAVEGHERPIQRYRLYYGTIMDRLDKTVDTQGPSSSWELRGLENGVQYFVAVRAVDTQGLESGSMGTVIAVTPVAPSVCDTLQCGEHGLCSEEQKACVCAEGWSGLTCDIPPAPIASTLQVLSYDGAVALNWPPFQGVQAFRYKVFMGFAPGQYSDYVMTADSRPSVTVADLINGVPYYFAVAALDTTGRQISPLSAEIQATPSGFGFHPAAPSPMSVPEGIYRDQLARVPATGKAGGEFAWVIAISLLLAHFLYSYKRRLLRRNATS